MTLLHPAYLWSLFLLLIPIAVHLFSKNNPPRIKIGSIKLLEQVESRTFRRVKFHDVFLFAFRALIFALLCILIASPEIACKYKDSERGWILIEPNLSLEVQSTEFHKKIDSLTKAGYEVRFLEQNFPTNSCMKQETVLTDIWSLLAEADRVNRDTLAFYVASPLRENSLQGKRPSLSRQVAWIEASKEETAWIERIAQISDDSLFVTVGISTPSETRIEHIIGALPHKATLSSTIELTRQGDSIGVSLVSNPNQMQWLVLSKQQSWCIVYDEHLEKRLPYLERAVKAIAKFSQTKISVEVKKQAVWQCEADEQTIWLCKNAPPKHPKLIDATDFSEELLLDENFIDELSEILLPEGVSEYDVRKASSDMATPIVLLDRNTLEETKQSLKFLIWIFVTLLFGLERWIAFSKE